MEFSWFVVQLVALWLVLVLAIPSTLRHPRDGGMTFLKVAVPPLLWVCAFRSVAQWATNWRSASWVVGALLAYYTFFLLAGVSFELPREYSLVAILAGSFLPTLVAAIALLFFRTDAAAT